MDILRQNEELIKENARLKSELENFSNNIKNEEMQMLRLREKNSIQVAYIKTSKSDIL